MYFDERPKIKKEDFYDREKELKELRSLIKENKPLIIIKGIRRSGKTSLIRVVANELKTPYIIVDLRLVNGKSRRDLYNRFQLALNDFFKRNSSIFDKLKEGLKVISGITVSGVGISLSWRNSDTLYSLISVLEKENFLIILDEVQEIRGPIGMELAKLIAHFYDYGKTRFILTGSEIGLLYDFLGVEDPDAPLYGRIYHEIELSRFTKEQSVEFLKRGFKQLNINVEEKILYSITDKLDGIVGWLVKFGVIASKKQGQINEGLIDAVLTEASRLSLNELKHFLDKRPLAKKRYTIILKAIANGKNRWTEIKKELEENEKKEIQDASLARYIDSLLKSSFIEKIEKGRNIKYKITDPVLEFALKKKK